MFTQFVLGSWKRRRRIFFVLILMSFYCKVCSKAINKIQKEDIILYDVNMPDYETFLTPSDFELAMEINDYPAYKNNSIENNWNSEGMYNVDKFEGDIANDLNASTVALFIRGAPENKKNAQYNAIRDRRQLWSNGKIPYAISSQYSSYSRSVIASAMQEYSKHTCIEWTPRTNMDRDYIYIVPERGCYSMVGRTGGRQTLSLGNGCIQKGIIIHEMMHAVGFFHEQSRTDRDEFITIIWNNILPGMQGQFEKYSQATTQNLGSNYDYLSIMHYGPAAFTRNGMPTIVPKKQTTIGQRTGFSETDSQKINILYECPSNGVVPNTSPVSIYYTTTRSKTTQPSSKRSSIVPSKITPEVSCKNTRSDCDQLSKQGWCTRNPGWMRDYCPISCDLCSEKKPNEATCEDLRVDCADLAKKRYCITAQNFTQTYCARSCGYCFVPPVTEEPQFKGVTQEAQKTLIISPTLVTQIPLVQVTFWPSVQTENRLTLGVTTKTPTRIRECRDKKHFCVTWKKAGFCQGIFLEYMKKNCALVCGWCN